MPERPLRVISGRVGDDTLGSIRDAQTSDLMIGSPDLESADTLEIFRFQNNRVPAAFVERVRGQERCCMNNWPYNGFS